MKNTFKYILFIIFLYFLFFNPPFYIFRGRLVLSNVIAGLSLIIAIIKPNIVRSHIRQHSKLFSLFFVLFLFVLLRSLVSGETSFITQHLLGLIGIFITLPLVFEYARRNGFGDNEQITRAIMIAASIGALITLYCVINPNFHAYLKYTVIRYNENDFLYNVDYRGFGFANQLTSDYGFMMGIFFSIGIYCLNNNKWIIPFLPLFILAALLNARTGFIVAIFGLISYILFSRKKIRSIWGIGLATIGMFLVGNFIVSRVAFSASTEDWLGVFMDELFSVAQERDVQGSATANALLTRMWVLPSTFSEWLFGKGISIFLLSEGVTKTSDVGWILQLNYGGLIYSIILWSAFLYVFKDLFRKGNYVMFFFLLSSIIILNTKCSIYPRTGFIHLYMMLYFIAAKEKEGLQHS